ncbi:MAG: chloride channel protein [Aerococcus sp.]|nr:chloride channel protein [Aerococcus sp.]
MFRPVSGRIRRLLVNIFLSLLIGGMVGLLEVVFAKGIIYATAIRLKYYHWLFLLLPLVAYLFTRVFQRYGKEATQGMGLIFDVAIEDKVHIPKRLIPFMMIGTWCTHLFGGSAGREGVAVQIGTAVSYQFGHLLPSLKLHRIFLLTGIAAGFGGLFGTPIAATFFALELVVVSHLPYEALLTSFIAAYTANQVAILFGIAKQGFLLTYPITLTHPLFWKLVLLGLIFGMTGFLFSQLLAFCHRYTERHFPNPVTRIAVVSCVMAVVILLCHDGRYAGTGSNLITAAMTEGEIYPYDWILKLIITAICVGAGFIGGEVTPLFAIGASMGAWLAPFFHLPLPFVASLGYCAVFASGTNTLLAPIMIGGELFGYDYLPYYFLVAMVSFIANANRSIYSKQRVATI